MTANVLGNSSLPEEKAPELATLEALEGSEVTELEQETALEASAGEGSDAGPNSKAMDSTASAVVGPSKSAGLASEAAAADLFSPRRKKFITATVAFGGFLGPIATAAYYPSLPQIVEELETTQEAVNLTIFVFTIGLAFFPLFWSSFSDTYGRRWIYFSSLSIFVVGSIGCALSPNIGCLIAMRIVQSCGSSALLTVGAGTISDIYVREERGKAMGFYYLGPLMGPAVSAPIGGIIAEFLSWRAIFYLAAGMGAFVLTVIMLILPETRKRQAGSKKRPNPFGTMVYLKHSFISLVVFNVSIVFATTFALQPEFPYLYTKYYGTSELQNGLLYLGTSAGQITGTVLGGYLADRNVRIWKEHRGGKVMAEDRLRSTWLGSLMMPAGLLIFGWSVQNSVFIAVPIIGQICVGYGMMSISTVRVSFYEDLGVVLRRFGLS
jgi:multidrug resistance protein